MRKYKRKSTRGSVSLETMEKAARLVNKKCLKVRAAARLYDICPITLNRFLERLKTRTPSQRMLGYASVRLVFTKEQEEAFIEKLRKQSHIHPVTSWDIRILALQFAVINQVKVPPSWEIRCLAGEDWLTGFYRRNDHLLCEFIPLRRKRYLNRLRKEGRNVEEVQNKFKQMSTVPRESERIYYLYVGDYNENEPLIRDNTELIKNEETTQTNEESIKKEMCNNIDNDPTSVRFISSSNSQNPDNLTGILPEEKTSRTNEEFFIKKEVCDDAENNATPVSCISSSSIRNCDNLTGIISLLDKAVSFYSINNNEENINTDKCINVFVYTPRTNLLVYIKSINSEAIDN